MIPISISSGSEEEIVEAKIWYSLDGEKSWNLYRSYINPPPTLNVKSSDDRELALVIQTMTHKYSELPPRIGGRPDMRVVMDTQSPRLVLIEPQINNKLSADGKILISWSAFDENLDSQPITLSYAEDEHKNWIQIVENITNSGNYLWSPPSGKIPLLLKVSAVDLAGNISEDIIDRTLKDHHPPVTRVTGPTGSKVPTFDLTYNAQDIGHAGLAEVKLYFQLEGKRVWHYYGKDEDLTSPFRFEAKQGGRYGFKLVGSDKFGNSEPKPDASTRPDQWVVMDSIKPVVKLKNFKGSKIPIAGGGKIRRIQWEASDDNMAEGSIFIELSTNDGHTYERVVNVDLPNTGFYDWRVPSDLQVNKARLKISAYDVLGNKGTDMSDAFVIDSPRRIRRIPPIIWDEVEEGSSNTHVDEEKSSQELLVSANEAFKLNDFYTTKLLIQKALRLDPSNHQAHGLKGRIYFRQEKMEKSESSYLRSVELNPHDETSRIGLGALYYTWGQKFSKVDEEKTKKFFKQAILHYEAATYIFPDNYEEYFNLGYIHARLKNYETALKHLRHSLALTSEKGDAYWFIGQIYEKLKSPGEAISSFQMAVEAYPEGSLSRQKAEKKIEDLISK